MKHLDGRADVVVRAPTATCFSLLADVERYPRWCGEFIREVTVVAHDADRRPERARIVVYVAQSPFGKRFEFDAAIRAEPPGAVHLSRLPSGPSDSDRFSLSWSLREDRRTQIVLDFGADVSFLPGLLPFPGVGDLIARTLVDAAARELDRAIASMPVAQSSS